MQTYFSTIVFRKLFVHGIIVIVFTAFLSVQLYEVNIKCRNRRLPTVLGHPVFVF